MVASREWGSYPIINFREVPVIEVINSAFGGAGDKVGHYEILGKLGQGGERRPR